MKLNLLESVSGVIIKRIKSPVAKIKMCGKVYHLRNSHYRHDMGLIYLAKGEKRSISKLILCHEYGHFLDDTEYGGLPNRGEADPFTVYTYERMAWKKGLELYGKMSIKEWAIVRLSLRTYRIYTSKQQSWIAEHMEEIK